MKKLLDMTDLRRLAVAVRKSRRVATRYRDERREMVRQYVGKHWFEEGSPKDVPVNLIGLYVKIISTSLIAKNPRVLISTFDRKQKPVASAMQSWANKEIEGMRLANSLQRVVIDALFSVGICKVALSRPADSARLLWNLPAGTPFAERVDLDDFVWDVHARDWSEVSFIGHRCRVPLDAIRDSSIYHKSRKELTPDYDDPFNEDGDERINILGRGYETASDSEEFLDFVDLWEIYIPSRRLVVTLPHQWLEAGDRKPLLEQEWLGPDCGPYHILGYGVVPGNIMPKAPIQDLLDLHLAINKIYRKLIRQSERQKQNVFVRGGATDDGDRVMQSNDGEVLRVDSPDQIRQFDNGGPNQANFLIVQHFKDLFSWLAGNLDIMGGLSPQSKTATQDKLLNENSSRGVADMQDRTVTFTSDVIESLCWYWHHDPFRVMQTTDSLPGLPEVTIQRRVHPGQRQQIRFADLGIKIDPYSMQHQTPQARAAALIQLTQQIVMPLAGLLQQQGISIDVNALLTKLAEYLDMPDLPEIILVQEPPQTESAGAMEGAGKPQETTRNYVRRSLGGESQQAKDMEQRTSAARMMAPQSNGNGQHV